MTLTIGLVFVVASSLAFLAHNSPNIYRYLLRQHGQMSPLEHVLMVASIFGADLAIVGSMFIGADVAWLTAVAATMALYMNTREKMRAAGLTYATPWRWLWDFTRVALDGPIFFVGMFVLTIEVAAQNFKAASLDPRVALYTVLGLLVGGPVIIGLLRLSIATAHMVLRGRPVRRISGSQLAALRSSLGKAEQQHRELLAQYYDALKLVIEVELSQTSVNLSQAQLNLSEAQSKLNQAQSTSVEAQLTSVKAQLTSVNVLITSVEPQLTSVKAQLTSVDLSQSSVNLSQELLNLSQELLNLSEAQLLEVKAQLTSVKAQLTSVKAQSAEFELSQTSVELSEAQLTSVKAQLLEAEAQLTSVIQAKSSVEAQLTSVEAQLLEAEAQSTSVEAQLTSVKAQLRSALQELISAARSSERRQRLAQQLEELEASG